jgi:hypothetical protein
MNWFALVVLIINILVLIFFILVAIVLNQVRHDKENNPNVVTVSSSNLTALWIGAIIFAVIAGIQVLTSIGAIFRPEYFGQEKCKKGITSKYTLHTPTQPNYAPVQMQPVMGTGQTIRSAGAPIMV